jgi:hypothetical protein
MHLPRREIFGKKILELIFGKFASGLTRKTKVEKNQKIKTNGKVETIYGLLHSITKCNVFRNFFAYRLYPLWPYLLGLNVPLTEYVIIC